MDKKVSRKPLSREAQDARKPLPPAILANALEDTVHRDIGRGRAAKSVKSKLPPKVFSNISLVKSPSALPGAIPRPL